LSWSRGFPVPQFEDEIVQAPGTDRVEAGVGFIEEKDFRVQGEGAGQTGPLAHSAGDLGGIIIFEAFEADQRQFEPGDLFDAGGRKVGVFAEGKADIFGEGHGTPERAALEKHAERSQPLLPGFIARIPEGFAVIIDVALSGLFEADHVAQQGALAAPAAAHDDEHLTAFDCGVDATHDNKRAVSHRQIANLDLGRLGRVSWR
jgi:hypothetical protein